MKSIVFTGKDKPDLDRKIWNWRSTNSYISVKKIHSIKDIPLRMHRPNIPLAKIKSQDRVSVKIDYEITK